MKIIIFLLAFFALIGNSEGCGLGRTISGITILKDGSYVVNCSTGSYPICPDVCGWKSETCDDVANEYHWNKDRLLMTNVTYIPPMGRNKKNGDNVVKSPQRSTLLPTTGSKSTTRAATRNRVFSKNKASTRGTKTNIAIYGVWKKCCRGTKLQTSNCRSVDWKMDPFKSENKFDVAQYSSQCPQKNALIQDLQVKSRNSLVVVVCCMNYSVNFMGRVMCTKPRIAGEGADIATDIGLPLALGFGIPLVVAGSCRHQMKVLIGYDYFCSTPPSLRLEISAKSDDECCVICRAGRYAACEYIAPGNEIISSTGHSSVCVVCTASNIPPTFDTIANFYGPVTLASPVTVFAPL